MSLDTIAATSWENARGYLRQDLERLQATCNTWATVAHNVDGTQKATSQGQILGQLTATLVEAQTLTPTVDDDGMLVFVSDYGRLVRYNASLGVWEDAPGALPGGMIQAFAVAPTGTGWALCDGSATTRLVVGGAALATAAFTTPNLAGSPAYLKSIALYTGTINAVSGSLSGSTAGQSNDHTHGVTGSTGGPSALVTIREKDPPDFTESIPSATHHHDISFTSGGTSADHTHAAGTLAVAAVDPANLGVLMYFKR